MRFQKTISTGGPILFTKLKNLQQLKKECIFAPRLQNRILHCGVEQLVARWAHNPKVTGSSPVPATKERR